AAAAGRRGAATMSRVLFVVPPLVGHINPAAAVADGLRRRAHEVAWAGDLGTLSSLLPAGSRIHHCTMPSVATRAPELRGFAALKYLWEQTLVPLTEAMIPGVIDAVDEFRPDVVVADQQAMAGALVAERLGIPWATSASTSAELTDPLSGMPKVGAWLAELLADLRRRFGDFAATSDLRFSPHLVLAFTTEAMLGGGCEVEGEVCFVGPVRGGDDSGKTFPWQALDATRPLVFVSLGTVNADAGRRFLGECVSALRGRENLQAVVVDPGGVVADAPDHVIVRPYVAQLGVLAQASAVICHAGHNTTCEALSYGLPLVVAPIRDDQPIIAEQVTRAGAGVRLRFDRAGATQIGNAIDAVLAEPEYTESAQLIRDSFRDAGGVELAADRLEALMQ
ncbi:MAG: glycosyltransferase, partial [Sciscionella sp.]